ncbi:unnamed protein product [Effrenium voratum]|uniref:SGNH hydrolase-type esterase domain-containing protein n=1 Tax=Effrenium voratum TaxID=2562239 RepID=A0AA36JSI7_9DINO|nr:unnamed protein product [Effrenium voratum]
MKPRMRALWLGLLAAGGTSGARGWTVGCFGDSHTEGIFGAEWVPQLQRRLRRECRNFGRNAWTCASVQRCAEQALWSPKATLLAGSNDAMMELAAAAGNQGTFEWITAMSGLSILDVGAGRWGAAERALCGVIRLAAVRISEFVAEILPSAGQNQLPADYVPSRRSFAKAFRSLLAAVPADRVAVLSLPPLGEAPKAANSAAELLEGYNQEIRSAVEADARACYVPFGEALQSGGHGGFDASSFGFAQTIAQMYAHTALQQLPFFSFDSLGKLYGRQVVHDKIHLTERSARTLVDLVAEAL